MPVLPASAGRPGGHTRRRRRRRGPQHPVTQALESHREGFGCIQHMDLGPNTLFAMMFLPNRGYFRKEPKGRHSLRGGTGFATPSQVSGLRDRHCIPTVLGRVTMNHLYSPGGSASGAGLGWLDVGEGCFDSHLLQGPHVGPTI